MTYLKNKYLFFAVVIYFLTGLQLHSFAQQPSMWQITDEQGLPSMTVYDVFQDSKGYIWFGTEVGLYRYDGNKFITFPIENAKGKAVTDIQEDPQGRLWFCNFSGQVFSFQNDQITELQLPEDLRLKGYNIFEIDQEGYLWFANQRLYHYEQSSGEWKVFDVIYDKENRSVRSLAFDAQNRLWIDMGNRVLLFQNGEIIESYPLGTDGNHSTRILITNDHIISVNRSTDEAYLLKNKKTIEPWFPNTGFKPSGILYAKNDREGNVWLCTRDGVFGFDKNLIPLFESKAILPNTSVSDIFQDREGNYWISSLNEGVFIIPDKQIWNYRKNNSMISDNIIQCITKDDEENLLLGLNNGNIETMDPATGQILFRYSVGIEKDFEGLYFDPQKKILYASCVCLYAFKKNNSQYYFKNLCDSPKMLNRFKDNLIVSTSWNAYVLNIEEGISFSPPLDEEFRKNFDSVSSSIKRDFTQVTNLLGLRINRSRANWGEKNRFWVAYAEGLFYYENGKEYEFRNEKGKSIYGRSFTQTHDETMWIGTLDDGVYVVKDLKIIRHITTESGISSNHCRTMTTDGRNVWIGTDKGINYFDSQKNKFILLNRQDGIMPNEILDMQVIGDYLWAGTGKGLYKIPKWGAYINRTPPPIYITDLKIWGKSTEKKSEYELDYDENNILIEFQGLAYRSRGEFKYKYRMAGLDSNWVVTESSNNFARFPSLPAGSYEFQVKAINEDGVESEGVAILKILVLPPFWQTWWFYAFTLIGIASLVSLLFYNRIRNIQRKNKISQDLRSSQLSSLKAQMNPHFIFNALNSIQDFILQNDKLQANRFLGKFADLMRLTLDSSNEIEISLIDELKTLELYLELEMLRFEEDFKYHIEVSPEIDSYQVKIPAMLIQPYVENAIKHGLLHKKSERKLDILFRLSKSKDILYCIIEDNGVGRKKSEEIQQQRLKKHKSFAMSANQKRLELLNYDRKNQIHLEIIDLQDLAGNALGTKVCISIPIS